MPSTPPALTEIVTRHAAHLERVKTHEARKFIEYLRKMERAIVAEIAKGGTRPQMERMERRLSAVREAMRGGFKDFDAAWKAQVLELAQYEAQFEARALNQVMRHNFELPSSDQVRQAVFGNPLQVRGADGGQLLDSVYEDWSNREIRRVSGAISMGYAQGQTTAEVIRAIRGTAPAKYTDGALYQVNRSMAAFVRTALQHSAVQAREATWARNSDIIKGVRWVSTLDEKTTTQCQAIDGQVFPLDSGPRPPAHWGCRSTVVAALDSRFSALEEGGTRSARDPETGKVESVPASMSYYQWLRQQPAEVQDSIIGPTRGKLLRDGGLTAQRFAELQLGKNFQPLTLAQMRNLEPLAFARAGLTE